MISVGLSGAIYAFVQPRLFLWALRAYVSVLLASFSIMLCRFFVLQHITPSALEKSLIPFILGEMKIRDQGSSSLPDKADDTP